MAEVEFHGAARTVTGSNFLVRAEGVTFIVDCGMFQGPDVESRNLEKYDYDPAEVDFVLLTHAHIDHCGMLPKLYRGGFRGPIYATNNTIQIATLLLLDSAKIQENNYQRGQKYGSFTDKVAFAYNTYDSEETIKQFKAIDFDVPFKPVDSVSVQFVRAGHILGASSIYIELTEKEETKKLIFSGDIGRVEQPLIESFDTSFEAEPDYIFIESLYGGVEHPDRQKNVDEVIETINQTLKKGGNVFIPAFSVQRTQEILHDLKIARDNGKISPKVPVWLDSPLAQKVSKIYTAALQNTPESSFDFENLRYVQKYRQSQALTRKKGQIIIAGSGMAAEGRILSHLAVGLKDSKNTVIFVGYQAEGTMGRELVEGAKEVTIGETKIPVNAHIKFMQGFSAHGDNTDYEQWVTRFLTGSLKKIFLIHAEEDRATALQNEFKDDLNVPIEKLHIPVWKEKVQI